MSGRIVHFELPYDDAERARSFYGGVFGWDIQSYPGMEYSMVSTGPSPSSACGSSLPRWAACWR